MPEYFILGRFEEARGLVEELPRMDVSDRGLRLNFEFFDACLLIQWGKREEGAAAFASMVQRYQEMLKDPELRYHYEDIQYRRALALAELSRCAEALPILKEAVSFSFEKAEEEQRINFWLGLCLFDAKDAAPARQAFKRVMELGLRNEVEENARYRSACFILGRVASRRPGSNWRRLSAISRLGIPLCPGKAFMNSSRTRVATSVMPRWRSIIWIWPKAYNPAMAPAVTYEKPANHSGDGEAGFYNAMKQLTRLTTGTAMSDGFDNLNNVNT